MPVGSALLNQAGRFAFVLALRASILTPSALRLPAVPCQMQTEKFGGGSVLSNHHKADVICDRCGESRRVEGGDLQLGTLSASWGPGSQHAGETYQIYLCESCFFSQLSAIKRERWTRLMFSEEGDVLNETESFGLVAEKTAGASD